MLVKEDSGHRLFFQVPKVKNVENCVLSIYHTYTCTSIRPLSSRHSPSACPLPETIFLNFKVFDPSFSASLWHSCLEYVIKKY